MKDGYSRKELQGWGALKHHVIAHDISFMHVDIIDDVEKAYSAEVTGMVKGLMEGIGFPSYEESSQQDKYQGICSIYDDLCCAGLKFISSLKLNQGDG